MIGEELRADIGAASFRIGPADHEGKSKTQQFCGFHEPGELPSGLGNGLIFGLAVEGAERASYLD